MTPTDLYKAGQLPEAIQAQTQAVKAEPAHQGKRLFLFELLAFAGEWDRARRQIEAVKYDDVHLDAATSAYRSLLDSETARRRLFQEGVEPRFLAEPPEHLRLRLQVAQALRGNQGQEAVQLLARADELTPAVLGQLNGKPFHGLRDCDDLFGPVLEVMAHGQYYWVALEQVRALALNPPRFPRDLIWLPARLEMADAAGDVFLPVLYPGSSTHSDPAVQLGRLTDWIAAEGVPVRGVGLRTFLVGDDAVPLLEWRELQMGQAD
jgi:type VI secretion system protein ImpE